MKGRGQDLAKIFHEEIEKCEPCRRRVAEGDARRQDLFDPRLLVSLEAECRRWIYYDRRRLWFSRSDLFFRRAAGAEDGRAGRRRIHDAFNHDDFSAERLGQFQAKLDRGIESMRKLVYAFYNEGFSFSQFLRKYPEQRVNIINLLIGDVFKEGVDRYLWTDGRLREIPPPLYEQARRLTMSRTRSAVGEVQSSTIESAGS